MRDPLEPTPPSSPDDMPKKVTVNQLVAGTTAGGFVGVVVVWYANTFVWPGKVPIEVATALGAITASGFATAYHLCKQLLAKFGLTLE